MRNDERSICIAPVGFCAERSRMYDGDIAHRNDVNVKSARAESDRWHATEESLKLLHANEHLDRCCSWLIWKCRAHSQRCVAELWLVDETDRCRAIQRRDLFKVPPWNAGQGDDRLGECGDRIVEIGPYPEVHDEFTHVPDGSAA